MECTFFIDFEESRREGVPDYLLFETTEIINLASLEQLNWAELSPKSMHKKRANNSRLRN